MKPFFFKLIHERLENESSRLLEAWRYNENNSSILEHYLLHRAFPDLKNNHIIQKLENHHEVTENLKFMDGVKP